MMQEEREDVNMAHFPGWQVVMLNECEELFEDAHPLEECTTSPSVVIQSIECGLLCHEGHNEGVQSCYLKLGS